jgi:hypothetical protein
MTAIFGAFLPLDDLPIHYKTFIIAVSFFTCCRLGGNGADGTCLYPGLQERTHASETPRHVEGEAFTNVSVNVE